MSNWRKGLISLAVLAPLATSAAATLISTGAVWRYHDEQGAPWPDWYRRDFDDSAWKSGPAQLGYGDGDETTLISFGLPRPVTTYFRDTFTVTSDNFFDTVTLRLLRDDGAIVYLNDFEIYRSNMPDDIVEHSTPATRVVGGDEESEYFQFGVWPYYLQWGPNTIAVEVHQAEGGIDDCSFDLTLLADLPLTPPTVRIVSPLRGAVLDPGDVLIRATADDNDGHVYLVEFYSGPNLIGTDMEAPYEFLWRDVPSGRYTLTAHAIDNSGRRGYSSPIPVQVGAGSETIIIRGPFLQIGTPNSIVVCWRTDWFVVSRIAYGTNLTMLDQVASDSEEVIDHALRLSELTPDTVYYFAILDASNLVLAGGPEFFFRTAPATNRPVRIWAIGDFGTADFNARAVRDGYTLYASNRVADVWLMLGDNAYDSGTDEEYQRAVFEMYPQQLRQTVVWPTLGNHDAGSSGVMGEFPYLDIFTLPTSGEAGGVSSGTEKYYSFDYANVHFICLDSQSSSRLPGSAMLTWLESDLATTAKDWIIAYWHHPPYSWGTHNSDYEHQLVEMRQYVVPLLDKYGVDLTLTGHSHNYERTFLLDGHYGGSWELEPRMILDSGFGHEDADHAYEKPAGGLGANQGSVHVVCGCSGQGGVFGITRHPAMRVAFTGFGSMVIDVDGDRLDAKFLQETGQVYDQFTILKSANPGAVRPRLQISRAGSKARLTWPTARVPYKLEESEGVAKEWTEVTEPSTTIGRWHHLRVNPSGASRLFRLRAD